MAALIQSRQPHLAMFFFFLILAAFVEANCYLPNGTDINQLRGPPGGNFDYFLPCKSSGQSMCCRTNGTNIQDSCLTNGLCHNDVAPHTWRESCTDPTWQDPACLQLCTSETAVNTGNPNWKDGLPLADSHVPLTECQDGSFCCGRDNTNCCSAGQGLWILPDGKVVSTKPSTSTSTASTISPTSSSSSAAAANNNGKSKPKAKSESDSSSNAGAIAGGVVGGVAGLALILFAVWFLLRKRKKNAAGHQQPPTELEGTYAQRSELPPAGSNSGTKPPYGQGQGHGYESQPQGITQKHGMTEVPGTHELPAR